MNNIKENFYTIWQNQLAIPGFDPESQRALNDARILILGVGGVGCTASLYITAAGVGNLVLVDKDIIEMSNLNRQILFGCADVGRPKVDAAANALKKINPHVNIHSFFVNANKNLLNNLIKSSDIIIDCFDRNKDRLIVNDICTYYGKAAVHSYVQNFSGYVISCLGKGGCLRCLVDENYPEPNENSVIGIAAGQAGLIAASEAIKHITGIGNTTPNRLIFYDLAFMEWSIRPIEKNSRCKACERSVELI